MAVTAFPARRRTRASAAALGSRVSALGARLLAPHKAALRNLAGIPLTVAAAGCVDAAGFVHSVFAGLIVTAASLVYIEHVIADER